MSGHSHGITDMGLVKLRYVRRCYDGLFSLSFFFFRRGPQKQQKGYPTWLGLSKWGGRQRELGEEIVMGKGNRKEKVRDPPCKR